jgi:DNA invertase Pin-like site-specific DNA recombinase
VIAYVAYLRVSTEKQGASGLGLDAQQAAVQDFTRGAGVIATYIEIESGAKADRPQLVLAIEHAKRAGARLLIAKLDRLARNVGFVANLMNAGVAFTCCDMPNASEFEINIRACLAQEERRLISVRTKAALAAAKARGVKLGGFRGGATAGSVGAAGNAVSTSRAAKQAASVAPMIEEARSAGALTLRAIAGVLNSRGFATPRGGAWSAVQVQRVLDRAA